MIINIKKQSSVFKGIISIRLTQSIKMRLKIAYEKPNFTSLSTYVIY